MCRAMRRIARLVAGVVVGIVWVGPTVLPAAAVVPPSPTEPSLASPSLADTSSQTFVAIQTGGSPVARVPKPVQGRPWADCTNVVVHSFTAQYQGDYTYLVAWSATVSCTPVSGWFSGSYSIAGQSFHWTRNIDSAAGTYLDKVPPLHRRAIHILGVAD